MRRWDVVDYGLQRRAVLAGLRGGRSSPDEVCDASPYLSRAAAAYGVQTDRLCPVCGREPLWEVPWVYGDALGSASGSSRSARQVAGLAERLPPFSVYEVEVCQRCGWNHLVRSWRTGTPGLTPARPPRGRAGR